MATWALSGCSGGGTSCLLTFVVVLDVLVELQVGSDQLRAPLRVDEPGAVAAGHLAKRRRRDQVDRGTSACGGEVRRVGSPDEHRRHCERGELGNDEDAFGTRPAEVIDRVHQRGDGPRVLGPAGGEGQGGGEWGGGSGRPRAAPGPGG